MAARACGTAPVLADHGDRGGRSGVRPPVKVPGPDRDLWTTRENRAVDSSSSANTAVHPGAVVLSATPAAEHTTPQYLLVAHHQSAPDALLDRVRLLAAAGACRCHVVVPASPTNDHPLTWNEDDARRVAHEHLVRLLTELHEIGVEATGEVGDTDVFESVADALRGRRVDEIILAVPSARLAHLIGRGPVRAIGRTYGVPVSEVSALRPRRADQRRGGAARPSRGGDMAPGARASTRTLARLEATLTLLAHRHGMLMLRTALGIVFMWFGALKVIGASPVGEIVARTLFVLPARPTMLALGIAEMAIGISFLTGRLVKAALVVFLVQMSGTFLTLVLLPDLTFQHGNPLLLSTVGEFVIKNLVLITAGIALAGSFSGSRRGAQRP
jgi:putative oxidoreductase